MFNTRKIIILSLALTIILACAACKANNAADTDNGKDESNSAQLANPFITCDTLAEAEEIAGFTMSIPDSLADFDQNMIQAVDKSMIQVFYGNDRQILVRKGTGTEDISGIYTEYSLTKTFDVSGSTVTLKGDGDSINLAVWTRDGYSYSVYAESGLSESEMILIVESVQ